MEKMKEFNKEFNVGDEVIFRNVLSVTNKGLIVECVRNNAGYIVEYIIITANSQLSITKNDVIRKVLSDLDISKLIEEINRGN